MGLGQLLLDIAQIADPLIALLSCAIWNDQIQIYIFPKWAVQSVLISVLVLSLLIPVVLIGLAH